MPEEESRAIEIRREVLIRKLDSDYPWLRSNKNFKDRFAAYRGCTPRLVEELENLLGLLEALKKSEIEAFRFEMERIATDFLEQAPPAMRKNGCWGNVFPNRSSIQQMFEGAAEETIQDLASLITVIAGRRHADFIEGEEQMVRDRLRGLVRSEIESIASLAVEYLWNELNAKDWLQKAAALRRRLEKSGADEVVFTDSWELERDPELGILTANPPYGKENDFRLLPGLGRGHDVKMVFGLRGNLLVLDQTSVLGEEKISGRYLLFPPQLKPKQIFSLTKEYLVSQGPLQIDRGQFFPSAFERLGLRWPEPDHRVMEQSSFCFTLESRGNAIHSQLKQTKPEEKIIEEKDLLEE